MDRQENIELAYFKAPFGKRIVALLIDIILMALISLFSGVAIRFGLENSRGYKKAFDTFVSLSVESKLYVYTESNDNLISSLEYHADQAEKLKHEDNTPYDNEERYFYVNSKMEEAYSSFYSSITFFPDGDGVEIYNSLKLGGFSSAEGDYFLLNSSNDIVKNPDPVFTNEKMFVFYHGIYESTCAYLANNDAYISSSRTLGIWATFVTVPTAIMIGLIFAAFLIPVIFNRRGWQTLGMRIMKLSLVNKGAISPRFGQFLSRFAWMAIVEVLASLVTFGIPLIVSFSLQVFRKDGQCFHDYMSGTFMVDSSDQSVYLSRDEYLTLKEKGENTASRKSLYDHPMDVISHRPGKDKMD